MKANLPVKEPEILKIWANLDMYKKLREARKLIDASGYDVRLQVDGGVSPANIKDIAEAGADMFVAGSAILKNPRTKDAYAETIKGMRAALAEAKV